MTGNGSRDTIIRSGSAGCRGPAREGGNGAATQRYDDDGNNNNNVIGRDAGAMGLPRGIGGEGNGGGDGSGMGGGPNGPENAPPGFSAGSRSNASCRYCVHKDVCKAYDTAVETNMRFHAMRFIDTDTPVIVPDRLAERCSKYTPPHAVGLSESVAHGLR